MDVPQERPKRPDATQMRASDADRDQTADRLREALAEGRLTPDEHAERLDAVFRAKTYAELAPLVEDLPSAGRTPGTPPSPVRDDLPAPTAHSPSVVAVFSQAKRQGRWLVEPVTNATSVFGDVELDLRQAVLSQREVTINAVAVVGAVKIRLPPGVRVINSVTSVFGACQLPPEELTEADAPVVRLTGLSLFGAVEVKRGTGGAADALRLAGERMREIHREFHHQRQELRHHMRREREEGS